MRSKMMMSLLVIALAAALVGGATMAWFTDAADTDVVEFQAGTLMINVDEITSTTADKVNIERLNPGDCMSWEFNVANVGTKSANWLLYACWQEQTGVEAGHEFGERDGYGTGLLSEELVWNVTVGEKTFPNVNLGEEGPYIFDGLTAFEAGEGSQLVEIEACLPEDAGNKYQGAEMEIYFGVEAWQTTNDAKGPTADDITCNFSVPQ